MSLKNDEAITNEVREGTFFGTSSGTEIIIWRAATVYWSQAGHGSLKNPITNSITGRRYLALLFCSGTHECSRHGHHSRFGQGFNPALFKTHTL